MSSDPNFKKTYVTLEKIPEDNSKNRQRKLAGLEFIPWFLKLMVN